ncbi:MAG TPA: hypothetical protein VJQ49_13020, partial [Casimicrobiaceae bacterium]|nr:hypothetical protein [Casimicrobiaceae bacterium]
ETSARAGEVALLSSGIAEASLQWRWSDPWRIAWNTFVGAPNLAAGTFLYRSGSAGALWHGTLAAIWAIVAAGIVALPSHRRSATIAAASALAFGLGLVVIAALRSFTPYYMTFVLLPAAALAAGAALKALYDRGPVGRAAAIAVASLIVSAQLAIAGGEIVRGAESWMRTALVNFWDFKHAPTRIQDEPLYPALTRDAVAGAICASARPVALHAMLATGFDIDFALETALACGRRDKAVLMGGDAESEHWVGMPAYAWRKLQIAPERRLGGYGVVRPASIVAPAAAREIASAERYPPHQFPTAPLQTLDLAFRAPANAALIVTDIVPWYMPLSGLAVTRAGAAVPATIASPSLTAFRCDDCDAREVEWTLHLQAVDPSWVDVVLLE